MNFDTLKKTFSSRGFSVSVFETKEDAARYLNEAIDGVSVAFGGSVTATELGLNESLGAHNTLFSHWHIPEGMTRQQVLEKASFTDVYLTSANGVSETGELVNIDGFGNRVASTLFGHKKVYFLIGSNKIEPTLDAAIHRARNVAAPLNAKRLGKKTPCAVKGDRCYNCSSPERICNGFVVLTNPMSSCKCEIVFINEPLGL